MFKQFNTLRLILGDQLNEHHSWFSKIDNSVLYVVMEIRTETDYVRHHIQKVLGIFAAMRLFAQLLQKKGHQLHYFTLDDPENHQDFAENCQLLIKKHNIQHFEYQAPDEFRVDEMLQHFGKKLMSIGKTVRMTDSEHFLTHRDELKNMFSGKKTYLLESFYRKMREKHQILMEQDGITPLTGRWNYDAENRKKMPQHTYIPPPLHFFRDVSDLQKMVEAAGVATIGTVDAKQFDWALTRSEALELLQDFVEHRLLHFGDFQDAMTPRDAYLFHSRLSFSMNLKMLHPREVIQTCIDFWRKQPNNIPFASLEGFVRQILGWREFVRGIYWAEMPRFQSLNFFEHSAPLPSWFWTGQTRMACLRHAIGQSLKFAYAHHIQRLMVTGNFALLLGAHPDEVDAWYLGIYADAFEWVEITNTRGMSQFADGGIVGTKPYVSTANYLQKMGDYCSSCYYNNKTRTEERACPFNSLYWDFYDRHASKLRGNPRIGMAYQIWDKMDGAERAQILERAQFVKENIENL